MHFESKLRYNATKGWIKSRWGQVLFGEGAAAKHDRDKWLAGSCSSEVELESMRIERSERDVCDRWQVEGAACRARENGSVDGKIDDNMR